MEDAPLFPTMFTVAFREENGSVFYIRDWDAPEHNKYTTIQGLAFRRESPEEALKFARYRGARSMARGTTMAVEEV